MVWDDLEMDKQICAQSVQEKLQKPHRGVDFEVEGAVHKLEIARATRVQRF